MQTATSILLVRPAAFSFNAETARNNFFQQETYAEDLQAKALAEFDKLHKTLADAGIDVLLVEDTKLPPKPDALFPNNWISTTPAGHLSIFPMYAPSRRAEKREDIIDLINKQFQVTAYQDWSEYETEGKFLEGTGSMVIDHDDQLIFACLSPRTHPSLLEKYAESIGYRAIYFLAVDQEQRPIYHTNVMMSIGEGFAVVCEEAITEEYERIAVRQLLESSGLEVITITLAQMHAFAGNLLQLKSRDGKNLLVLSATAMESLRQDQLKCLEKYGKLLPVALPTIEKVEGGSARCMIAEIFLPRK